MQFETFALDIADGIATLASDRAAKANAFDAQAWRDLRAAFEHLDTQETVRAVVLRGNGRHFSAGIDFSLLSEWIVRADKADECPARLRDDLRRWIIDLQDAVNAIERCRKPVIAAIHGACLGIAVDVVTACDLRYCTADAKFAIREIDFAVTADLGVLQRLPRLVGDGIARELVFTGRDFDGREAYRMGLVSASLDTQEALEQRVAEVARMLAAKPPLTMQGCKKVMLHARDHSVAEGLDYVATWNAATLLSQEMKRRL